LGSLDFIEHPRASVRAGGSRRAGRLPSTRSCAFTCFFTAAASTAPARPRSSRPSSASGPRPPTSCSSPSTTGAATLSDFRYTQDPSLTWYFDHHASAFQLPGDRDHFEADRSGQKFHDPSAPSCTGYIARIAAEKFGFDPTPHAELLHWAEVIDSANFATPAIPVLYEEPALQLAAWIQSASDADAISGFIDDLLNTRMGVLAQAQYVRDLVEPRLDSHRADIDLIRAQHTIDHGVFCYDLIDFGPRILSHFIPYWIAPKVRYCVGVYAHSDGDLRLSVGYNPWLPAKAREHDVAALCERHGGGGHPYVAGASLPADHVEGLRAAMRDVVETLTGRKG
jgi:hypothetical protein